MSKNIGVAKLYKKEEVKHAFMHTIRVVLKRMKAFEYDTHDVLKQAQFLQWSNDF